MHAPVLVAEVISHLAPARGGLFVDCTLGAGGHTRALLDAGATRVLGFDRDRTALALAAETLARPARPRRDGACRLPLTWRRLDARGIASVDGGILADLGVSSMQLDDAERGFSFRADAPLDMRMDRDSGLTAAALLQTVDEAALADVIYEFGEERFSRRIARGIVRAREAGPIETTGQLAAIVRRAVPTRGGSASIPRRGRSRRCGSGSTANSRASTPSSGWPSAGCWRVRGLPSSRSTRSRTASSSTRSGPLRRRPTRWSRLITRRPIEASEDEIARNPRARSAKLRVAERLA